ncbi:TPA: YhfX family PLP-dependent enzyme [Yersinia enterocolitica]|uniref:YhfX family PLP-dependent enzyme n=1 Tax=Yersinia enterocolitica TaxID=630 RepID=UPI0032F5B2D4|nr:YhfX family PLP-dependent enzyme [Yersinia enterocolitica]EKN4808619.1 YhfX family PLP-dependent enzyme [Yersinia enterocolitica]HDL7327572.1 YhfX family PLP-dependent enzyme [Yersinia enterocolitica]HDL7355943.1 YhfX family PLP-dependent enzyme [Yersinia enterocolitica]HDL7958952.1 YhfX family PLP-dependent enzyme [Yersinia enterocolitica]
MFLKTLLKQNTKLIDAAIAFWHQGKIYPDSYVIDVEQTEANARLLLQAAHHHQVKLYLMSKQFGRNPELCRRLLACSYQGTHYHGMVAVDFKEARQLYRHAIPVAHIGHLVQPPSGMLAEIIRQRPEVITVFSLEKALEISQAAHRQHIIQPLMLKVCQSGDLLYSGQEAGFELNHLPAVIAALREMPGVRLVGITHFPCMVYDPQLRQTLPTANMQTLLTARDILQAEDVTIEQVNAPSATSCTTLPLLAKLGVTHSEPGHALTGTMPANQHGDQPERISMLYLSEISHHFADNSYVFGGGYYRRGHLQNSLIWHDNQFSQSSVLPIDNDSIDYCLRLAGQFPVGSPVIMCFRTQIFVTRSDVVLIDGIQSGTPRILGCYDSQGNRLG